MTLRSTGWIIILILVLKAQSQESNSLARLFPGGKSIGEYARQKVADLHLLKSRLEKHRLNQSKFIANTTSQPTTGVLSKLRELSSPEGTGTKGQWNLVMSLLSAKSQGRSGFWSKFLPSPDILKRLSKMRDNLEPNVKSYLTGKYNDFLTNLIPYSDNIGIPPFVLNSMKIPENFDPRWNYIQKLLETSSLDQFFQSLPDFNTLRSSGKVKSLNAEASGRMIQSRGDDEFISDQEPQATSKGKKKYRLPSRLQAYRKGELAGSNSDRASYGSYGSYGEQYSQPSNSYDSIYNKAYEDYYAGGKGSGDKGSFYEENFHKGKAYSDARETSKRNLMPSLPGIGGKYLSTGYGETFGAGHSSYSTSKGHGHGHGQGGGGYGQGLGGYLDPFSILGGLAFLTYLGLLFQQSLTTTAAPPPGRNVDEEHLNSEFDFDGLSFLSRANNRQRRSWDASQRTDDQLDVIEHGIKSVLSTAPNDCPVLQYCKVLKQIQMHHIFTPLRLLLETAILEQYPKEKENLRHLNTNLGDAHSDCSLIYECYSESKEQTPFKF